jgi:hypothetical protein
MTGHGKVRLIAIFAAIFPFVATAQGQDYEADTGNFELGLRANVLLGDGVPANDILGVGVMGRYHLSNGWFAGVTLDAYEYDYEHAARMVGIEQDPDAKEIDAAASNTVLGGFIGRLYGKTDKGFDWFWSAGAGLGFADIDDLSGTSSTGEPFTISYDAGNEIHLMGTLGTSYHFSPSWSASFAARVEHHFMDVKITDVVSGATGTLDSQSPLGAYLSLDYQF